jgi:hypothetical protein
VFHLGQQDANIHSQVIHNVEPNEVDPSDRKLLDQNHRAEV